MLEHVLQALLVAGVTAAASGYVLARILDVKLTALRELLAFEINSIRERLMTAEKEIVRLREWKHANAGHLGWVDQQRRVEYNRRHEDQV